MDRGYVKLWRKIEDSGLLSFPGQLTIWIYLLIKAAHKPYTYPDGNTVEMGQLITSTNKLATITGLSRQAVRTALKGLVAAKRITLVTNNRYTLVTIEHYLQYNHEQARPATNSQPTPNQLLTSNQPQSRTLTPTQTQTEEKEESAREAAPSEKPALSDSDHAMKIAKGIVKALTKRSPQGKKPDVIGIHDTLLILKGQTSYTWQQIADEFVHVLTRGDEFWIKPIRNLQYAAHRDKAAETFEGIREDRLKGARKDRKQDEEPESGQQATSPDVDPEMVARTKATMAKLKADREKPQGQSGDFKSAAGILATAKEGNTT